MEFSQPVKLTDLPPVEKRVAELIRVPAAETLKGTICSDQVWSLPTHWHEGRTRPCTEAQGACELCGVAPSRWYGLLALYLPLKQKVVWIQLTAEAVGQFQLAMRERVDMLGREIEIGRERKTLRAPVWIRFTDQHSSPKRLPKAATPHQTLNRVFFPPQRSRPNARS